MANNSGKTITALLVGVAVGAVAGYFIGTDEEKREKQFNQLKSTVKKGSDELKHKFNNLKEKVNEKMGKKVPDIEEEIYNA